ncbi:hypothetical protein ES702_01067 [subsurface metagenome]
MEWLKGSQRRSAIIKVMTKPKITCEIHEQALNGVVSLSNTSEILKALLEEGLVICINPKEKIGRLYALIKRGKIVRKKVYPHEPSYHDISREILKDYAYIVRGKHRRAVIKVMSDRKTPSEIHKDVIRSSENIPPSSINYVKLSLNSTSDTLRGFRKKGIAICINKEKRVGRLYELTKKGKAIREQILKE